MERESEENEKAEEKRRRDFKIFFRRKNEEDIQLQLVRITTYSDGR